MFLHRSHVITYVIFCFLSVISPFASAMKSSSDLHFYGNRRENRNHTLKNTINFMPITELASPSSENLNASVSALVVPLTSEKLNETATYLTTPPTTSILPIIVITHPEITCDQLSDIFSKLQKEPMSADERHESFLRLKDTVHKELKRLRSLDEKPGNVVRFTELEKKIFLLMKNECFVLQARCLAAQPDLDDID